MNMTRRELLLAAGAIPLATSALGNMAPPGQNSALPFKAGFALSDVTYLNSGSQHPVSLGALKVLNSHLKQRSLNPAKAHFNGQDLLKKYSALVNADVDEVTFVQSTTTGEQMFLRALGLPESGGHVVTDTLHFFGSFPLYLDLQNKGVDVTWVRDRNGRILLEDMKKAIRPGTKLVALSLISTINGFQHDLKAVCDIAHEAGALVYADVIHAVGSTPVDLHASGVDFAAGASYKWLMGDFGLGFMYVRKEHQSMLKRCNYGYFGWESFQLHVYPYDTPGEEIADYKFQDNATGHFALGTHAATVGVQLHHSLDYLHRVGVANIQAYVQTLIQRLREELPERGFTVFTPEESRAPIITCTLPGARKKLSQPLKEAGVKISLSTNRFRVTPSVFNGMDDIDRLLEVIGRV